jgi:hypothetical protein
MTFFDAEYDGEMTEQVFSNLFGAKTRRWS